MTVLTERKLVLKSVTGAESDKKLFSLARIWLRNYRTRKALKDLPDHLLRDIGRTAAQASEEARKPFWR